MGAKALFLDRDGTLIVHRPYLSNPDDVALLPGVRETLQRAMLDGYLFFLFTNQSGVGRGYFNMEDVHRCNRRMLELLGLPDFRFTEVCIAPERPEESSLYRKPSPRFINEMKLAHRLDSEKTWMVGDARSDVLAGQAAGVGSVLIGATISDSDLPSEVLRCNSLSEFYQRLALI